MLSRLALLILVPSIAALAPLARPAWGESVDLAIGQTVTFPAGSRVPDWIVRYPGDIACFVADAVAKRETNGFVTTTFAHPERQEEYLIKVWPSERGDGSDPCKHKIPDEKPLA